ncbi:hypothetical protein EMIHUDRAFT_204032 [Emiliania huxleyi CCMP1516]|uniref:WLM domain-containing protein n=2 Tax=Emiliania huxleyi TaxID=2903 RepID=A0A0D3K0U6_EMIH1|nr:hypothetical protein EMIHUDRAFT_204032 [Emiliania huxleyi CCMP1516]EOD29381.1 hypothetical protein EMIHUDRAFT_204032 [Emiliania huxleyi CCMP1516]|eukprot:XP_005781810.1 hypothetical protein EMIHUDRAFT_204032 [Emiliania huxleyi CCMP1516]
MSPLEQISLISQRASYLQAREAKLKACRFNLSALPAGKRVHDTSRTIKKPTPAWAGFWPALREFMQNTIDHLDLAPRGRLHPALSLRVERPAGQRGTLASIAFRCGDEPVCAIEVEEDELRILQHYTFPLHPRALETGVPDAGKGGDATAGGFGDGFKTAAAALLGQPACRSISWTFETAEGRTVRWDFVGAERPAVGNFRASRVLERVRVGGIGRAFLAEAAPRLQVFWSLPDAPLIEGAIMAFWSKLNVSSRDRNDGKKAGSSASGGGSWLLRTPRFTNRLLEAHRPFFLGALGVPAGALFASRRTTESGDPFLKWAAAFLARRGAPLLPLEPGASKALFSEASEDELQERCVKELLAELKKAPAARTDAQQAAAKLLAFVGAESRSLRLHFSALVAVPFAHGAHVFMPATALDRGLLLRLLATLQKRLGRFDDKCVHATQAFFETLPAHGGLSLPQLDAALSRAKQANESEEKCLRGGHDALKAVAAHDSVGGGEVYSDVASAAHLAAGTLPKAAQLKALRAHLEQAKRTLAAALPSLGSLLEGTVKAGFDVGGAYLGFCSERAIVVNLAPLLRRWNEAGTPVELLLTLAHEAAHLLSRGGAHDSAWRQTYDELIQAAIVAGVGPAPGAFAGVGRRA